MGVVHVDRPTAHIVARETDTNWEETFAPLLDRGGSSRVGSHLQVTDGIVVLDDVPDAQQFRVEELAIDAALTESLGLALALSTALPKEQQPGSFKIDVSIASSQEAPLASGKGCRARPARSRWKCYSPVLAVGWRTRR